MNQCLSWQGLERRRRSIPLRILGAVVLLLAGLSTASAQVKVTVFSVNNSSATFVQAINLGGTIAGSWFDSAQMEHGFLRSPSGTITTFDPPTDTNGTTVFGMNNPGAAVGYYLPASFTTTGFVRSPAGTFTDVFYPGSFATEAHSINDAGVIAGSYNFGTGFIVSPPYGPGDYTSFSIPGGAGISVQSINNAGQVAGIYFDPSNNIHGFVWDPATSAFTFYDAPSGFTSLEIFSMNDNAEVTGLTATAGFTATDGFVGQGGVVTDVFRGATFFDTIGESINLSGQVVGINCGNGFTPCFGFLRNPATGDLPPLDVPAKDESLTTIPTAISDLTVVAGNWINSAGFHSAFVATVTQQRGFISGAACNGTYKETFNGDVIVSAGQTCNLTAGRINGNVTLNGGTLGLSHATVSGNVTVTGGNFAIGPSTTIAGNVTIEDTPGPASESQICGTTVQGNLLFQNDNTAFEIGGGAGAGCAGNTILGNVQVNNNNAPATVVGNTIAGNLTCTGNTSISGSKNTVSGQKQGQCSSF